jgi:hypothetical protein
LAVKLAPFSVAVARPVPVIVTCAVAVAVDVPGAYCTVTVQLPPGATTKPDAQVPPVVEKAPPALPTLAIVGAAVNVNGPAFAPVAVLLTVIVPLLVFVLAVVVVSNGEGTEMAAVAPVTVNDRALLVPFGVVTLRLWTPSAEFDAIVSVTVTVLSFTTTGVLAVTPPPDTFTAVAPVRLLPVRVKLTLVPRTPALELIEVSVGGGGTVTVNVTALVVPLGVVSVTFLAVAPAPAAIVSVAVTVVSFTTTGVLVVTPPPDTLTAVAPVRPAPVMVTGTAVPLTPVLGVIEVSPVAIPLSVTEDVPPGVVLTASVPRSEPAAVGANRTRNMQLAPAVRAVPVAHVVAGPRLYGALMVMAPTVSVPPPMLVKVTVWATLVVPTR